MMHGLTNPKFRVLASTSKPSTANEHWHTDHNTNSKSAHNTYEWYCACRKLNSSLIRSQFSATVNFSCPGCGGGPCWRRHHRLATVSVSQHLLLYISTKSTAHIKHIDQIPVHVMKSHESWGKAALITATTGEWTTTLPGPFTPDREITGTHWMSLGWPRSRSGRFWGR